MIESHLRDVDLNLLVYLELLLEESSVTLAARRAGVTQSAMSRALGRLRALFDDPILVRSGSAMVATARARSLRPRVRDALRRIVHDVLRVDEFVPETAERTFTIGSTDMSDLRIVTPVVRALAREAPGISLRVRGSSGDLASALEAGEIDMLIGVLTAAPASIRTRALVTEGFGCLVRPGHPALQPDGTLDFEGFVASPHVLVSPRGRPGGFVDTLLAERGLERRVAVQVQAFSTAPALLPGTDYVLTYPAALVDEAAARWRLVATPTPFEAPPFTLGLYWHERWQHEPGHSWMRERIAAIAGE